MSFCCCCHVFMYAGPTAAPASPHYRNRFASKCSHVRWLTDYPQETIMVIHNYFSLDKNTPVNVSFMA